MSPSASSRYQGCKAVTDEEGRLYLTDREPYRYRELPDNRVHTVVEGDTLFTLAGRYFAPLPRACGYWWVIADFQPDPIHDPTLKIRPGVRLVIPSVRQLSEIVMGAGRFS